MPEQIYDAIKWVVIISCTCIWIRYLIKDIVDFLLRDGKAGDTTDE